MGTHHFSPLCSKGWLRLALAGTAAFIPLAGIEHSLGLFNDGLTGLLQASEFCLGGAALMAVIGLSGPWIARGFVRRTKTDEDMEPSVANDHGDKSAGQSLVMAKRSGQPSRMTAGGVGRH
jgi:hypothetical protein